MRPWSARKLVSLVAALAVVVVACGGATGETGEQPTLYVDLSDYRIAPDKPVVPPGRVVIGIRNHASMSHDLKVIKTDAAPDQLPYDQGAAKVKEDGKVAGLENIPGGASRKLVVADLAPGRYVLICNVAGHYLLGMRAPLEVK